MGQQWQTTTRDRRGYSNAQNGISPAYACVGHSHGWCDGYNSGFRPANDGSNIYDSPNIGQTATIDVHGNNNKIITDQQPTNQVGDNDGLSSGHVGGSRDTLPKCVILYVNSDIRMK
jgi:hypothetical protein